MKILVVGPSPEKSKGGMATVIDEIHKDVRLKDAYQIEVFDSYIDGSKPVVAIYAVFAFLKFVILKRNYDIYHIHTASKGSTFRKNYYIRAAKKWGKKVILHIHGARYMEFYGKLSTKKKHKVVAFLKSADLVIALSEDWKHKFDNTFGLANCVVLENGIDMCRLQRACTMPSANKASFVMLGRLGERKGTYDLVDAIEMAVKVIPNIKCYLAGDGEVAKFKNMVKERRLEHNIEVVGWASFEKKLDLLGKVSTVVLPSYNEGLPMSILEGMACGKMIVSTTVGAIPEVVQKDNGILVAPGDKQALSKALIRCCMDTTMMENISSNNIKKIRNAFSMEVMHNKLANYYEEVEK